MKALPIRGWLGLLLVVLVAVPALATVAFGALRPPKPPPWVPVVPPALRAELTDNVGRWADPTWQAGLGSQLAAAGLAAVLVDGAGQTVYRSGGAASVDATTAADVESGTRPARVLVVNDGGGQATATLYAAPGPGPPPLGPPRGVIELWLIPLAQLVALLLIAAAIALFVNRAFLRPLAAMIRAMRQVGAGDLDVRLPTSRVTEVNDVAAAFAAMSEALRDSLERQEELEQERRMTISAVVHDLRTPLFSLRGYLEGLAAGLADSPEKAARYVRICREQADALDRLVSDLFAYTRTEYLEEVPRPEPLDLRELLTRTAEGLQPQAAAKGVSLRLDGADGPVRIAGDAHLLTRAVENVLDNAIRHTPAGGEVRVAWRRFAGGVAFTVTDTGPGIAAVDLPHLFAPLYRGEASRNRRTGGAGLGLAIARRLLRVHGGELTAANVPNGGAVFTGTLPGLGREAVVSGVSGDPRPGWAHGDAEPGWAPSSSRPAARGDRSGEGGKPIAARRSSRAPAGRR